MRRERVSQRVNGCGIELGAGVALELDQGDRRGARRTIGARAHRVEGVGHVHDARVERDVVAEKPKGYPLPSGRS